MWNFLLHGISSEGRLALVEISVTQIGNIGGEPFWRWFGFNHRVEWCAVFVSWCAEQLGLTEAGVIPRFALVDDGVRWFKTRYLWQNSSYTPLPGDLIFFDWDGAGSADHMGIVERVDGEFVYAIEGNTSDMVARRRYRLNSSVIMVYGVPGF